MKISDIDNKDREILNILQQDGKIANAQLAEMVNLSPSACLRRVKLLEQSGITKKYALILDQKNCGMAGNAFINISLNQQGREALDDFEKSIMAIPEVVECYLIAGDTDYMVRIIYSDSDDFERIHTDILTKLPGVVRINTTLSLRTVKKTTAIPI